MMDGSQLSPQAAPDSQSAPPPSMHVPPAGRPWPTWLRVLVPLFVLGLGAAIALVLVIAKPSAKKKDKPQGALPVEVVAINVGDHDVVVRAQGTVRAARLVVVQPEITGRVTWLADELVPGGQVKRGQPLVRINPRDYQLAVKQKQAQVASQALALRMEKARQGVAAREWEIYQAERTERQRNRGGAAQGPSAGMSPDPAKADAGGPTPDDVLEEGELALREPQVKSAEIALRSARSGLSQAQLQLARTSIQAPFNAFVQTEAVEVGQLVSPASQLATLVGTDTYWVQVSLPVEQLSHIYLPRGDQDGSAARIWFDAGEDRVEREGRVIRLLGDLDPVGRMARVIVEIDDPFGHKEKQGQPPGEQAGAELEDGDSAIPLLLGSFVNVEIHGKTLDNVAEIPTRALQPEDRVYVMGDGDKLVIHPVQIIARRATTTLVRGDLAAGDKLVLTTIDTPVAGMALREMSATAEPSAASAAPTSTPSSSGDAQ